jgi:hypothetical protein
VSAGADRRSVSYLKMCSLLAGCSLGAGSTGPILRATKVGDTCRCLTGSTFAEDTEADGPCRTARNLVLGDRSARIGTAGQVRAC